MELSSLPPELVWHIAANLDVKDLVNFSFVSKKFYELWGTECVSASNWKEAFLSKSRSFSPYASEALEAYKGLHIMKKHVGWKPVHTNHPTDKLWKILKDDLVGVRCSVTLDMPSLYAALMVYDIRHNFRCEWTAAVHRSDVIKSFGNHCHTGIVSYTTHMDFFLLRLMLENKSTGELTLVYHSTEPRDLTDRHSLPDNLSFPLVNSGLFVTPIENGRQCIVDQIICIPFPEMFDDEDHDSMVRTFPRHLRAKEHYYKQHQEVLHSKWLNWGELMGTEWISRIQQTFSC